MDRRRLIIALGLCSFAFVPMLGAQGYPTPAPPSEPLPSLPPEAPSPALPPDAPSPVLPPDAPLPSEASWAPGVPGAMFYGDFATAPAAVAPFEYEFAFQSGRGLFGPSSLNLPQDPADSLYREARQLLNRGDWRRAAERFAAVANHRPPSGYAADALYWQAFALHRIGGITELRQALASLETRRTSYPDARSESDAETLRARIRGALAARGDDRAAAALAASAAQGGAACDSEELSVRSSALSALMRADPAQGETLLLRVLERKDECSVPLRKSAVMLIGTRGDASAKARLTSVARTDPSDAVRADAIGYLARVSGDEVVATLEQVIRGDEEERVQRAAVRALGNHESPRAKAALKALIVRSDAPERLRLEALGTFDEGARGVFSYSCDGDDCRTLTVAPAAPPAPPVPGAYTAGAATAPSGAPTPRARGATTVSSASGVVVSGEAAVAWSSDRARRRMSPEDAAWLRGVYPRLETTRLKSRAVTVLVRSGDEATMKWIMDLIAREDEPADIRAAALSRLGRDMPIEALVRFYDSAGSRTIRRQIVSTLGSRDEPEATDKLIDIVRTGTDPQLRRSAISALGRKKDPRTTQLLLELIDK
ncbi:MAG TPA: HEAT repeat domain-containing protein [Gemmatimonadaceae bacterium]|nr:HEAT repeat domain-containing protein [Gemmatimonadaceae bacterium]